MANRSSRLLYNHSWNLNYFSQFVTFIFSDFLFLVYFGYLDNNFLDNNISYIEL